MDQLSGSCLDPWALEGVLGIGGSVGHWRECWALEGVLGIGGSVRWSDAIHLAAMVEIWQHTIHPIQLFFKICKIKSYCTMYTIVQYVCTCIEVL